jgi:hypothetical protein
MPLVEFEPTISSVCSIESQVVLKTLSLSTWTFLALAKEVLIYTLKPLCRNIFFSFLRAGVTLLSSLPFKQPQKKSQGLRSGERAGQTPLLIILSPKTSDKACIDTCSVGSS